MEQDTKPLSINGDKNLLALDAQISIVFPAGDGVSGDRLHEKISLPSSEEVVDVKN